MQDLAYGALAYETDVVVDVVGHLFRDRPHYLFAVIVECDLLADIVVGRAARIFKHHSRQLVRCGALAGVRTASVGEVRL